MKLRLNFSRIAWIAGFGLLILLAVQLLFVNGVTLHSDANDAAITFTADRSSVFAMGDCVSLTWDVQNVLQVYLGERAVRSTEGEIFCLNTIQTPTLNVIYNNGSLAHFPLFIRTFVDRAEVWIVGIGMLLCFGAGVIAHLMRRYDVMLPRMTRAFAWIGAGVVLIVGVFGVLEAFLRVYFGAHGTLDQRISYVLSRDEINAIRASTITLPDVEFALSPEPPDHNSLGYRGEEIVIPKPEGVYRIIAMGGSNTYGHNLTAIDAYPAQLERVLREEYGYNVEVINAGVGGYTSFHIAANFASRYLELEPDMAIYYESTNDVRLRERAPDCYRGMNVLRGLNPQPITQTDHLDTTPNPSVLVRFLTINLNLALTPTVEAALVPAASVACAPGQAAFADENVAINPPVYFERNLTNIIGLATIHDIDLMFASWAYRLDAEGIDQYWRDAVAEHNQVVRRVAEQYSIPFLDYALQAPIDPDLWLDYMHMNADGLRLQAEAFAAFIHEQGVIPHNMLEYGFRATYVSPL